MEVHPNPEAAMSDGPNAWPLEKLDGLVRDLQELDSFVKQRFQFKNVDLHVEQY
jgi:2-dehydro-3-deoxyphosphooctonate aldolase (KDO 8-P synthase)